MMALSWCARTKYDNLRDCRGVRERTGTCHENDSGRLCLVAVVFLSANILVVSYLSLVALAKFLISWYTRVCLKTAFCGGVQNVGMSFQTRPSTTDMELFYVNYTKYIIFSSGRRFVRLIQREGGDIIGKGTCHRFGFWWTV